MKHCTSLRTLATLTISLGLATVTSIGHAEQEGWYLGSSISSVDIDDTAFSSNGQVNGVQSPRNLVVSSDSDVGFGGSIGYRFSGNSWGGIRVEGEFQYSKHDVEQINFNGNVFTDSQGFVEGKVEALSGFINIAQEFGGLGVVRPYVGIGVGLTEFYGDFRYNPNLSANVDSDDDTAFAYQAFVGLDVDFTDRITGFIDYRFVETDEIELDRFGGGAGGPALTSQEGEVELDAFTLGLRYSFR